MRSVPFLIVLTLLFGCNSIIEKEQLRNLNGYWEIFEVEFPNGQKKKYGISTTIDYIELNDTIGFRKKVQPQLSGSYITSNDAERFEIYENNGVLKMVYGQGTQQWEAVITSIEEHSFSVQHMDGKIYYYKRYEPLNLQP